MIGLGIGLGLGLGGGFASSFSPSSIAKFWWRADLGLTQVAGPKVSHWLDQIAGLDLAQATDGNRPGFTASDAAYNNKPLITPNASTWLVSAAQTLAQPFSVFIVGQNNTAGGTLLATSNSASTDPIVFNSSLEINAGTTVHDPISVASPSVMLGVFNGASSFVGASDWLAGGTSGDAGAGNATLFAVGAYSAGDYGAAGKVAEIIVLDHVASSPEKVSLAAYFQSRYGLTVT